MAAPWVAAALGAGSTMLSNLWSARRADTAHRREVKDLREAGLNPILSASARGAEVGDIRDPGQGAASAVAASRARAEIELLKASADREAANAALARTQAWELTSFAPGRGAETQMRTLVQSMEAEQRRQLLPLLVENAREEIKRTVSSARQANAIAALDELAREGAVNVAAFERQFGEMSPRMRFILEMMRTLVPGGIVEPRRR